MKGRLVQRSGDRAELLKGPVIYGLVHGLLPLFCWRDSPIGILVLAILCAGDGIAAIVGRAFGEGNRLPHNPDKSWAGSVACLVGGFLGGFAWLCYFRQGGYILQTMSLPIIAAKVFFAASIATAVESLPLHDFDNITVTAGALLGATLAFGQ